MRRNNTGTASTHELRIALYSHDTCGLGHVRRNLSIAEALSSYFDRISILLITGAKETTAFRFPSKTDAVTLPSLQKEGNEIYRSRSLGIELTRLIELRAGIIQATIECFEPDVFIVDKVPRGAMGELGETLGYLKNYTSTRCVLGLRDILDKPETVAAEWKEKENFRLLDRYYDAVWIYGDASVYDSAAALQFPVEIARKTAYSGYLNPTIRLRARVRDHRTEASLRLAGDRFFLCTVGGGQDGAALAEAFTRATFPEGVKGVVLAGPHMPSVLSNHLQRLVDERSHLHLEQFLPEPLALIEHAERVVCMGGYNTLSEVVAVEAKALVVPRVQPREEQWIRARAFQRLGRVDVLHPQALDPERLSNWFFEPAPATPEPACIDMGGFDRIPGLVQQLISNQSMFLSTNEHHHVAS